MKRSGINSILITCLIISLIMIENGHAVERDNNATLKDLRKRSVDISHAPVETSGSMDKAIEGYKAFLNSPVGGAMRREALRRLADQIIDKLEEAEYNLTEESIEANNTIQTDSQIKDATYDDAIKFYEESLASFPDALGNEHIYYQLARAYEANGQPLKALKTLESLSNKFPNTTYTEEAYFRQAEVAFLLRKYKKASDAYKRVLDYTEKTQYHEIALYKYAWSLFKQDRLEEALNYFYTVLDRSIEGLRMEDFLNDMPTLSLASREMVKDTLRVIALSYTDINDINAVNQHFTGEGNYRDYEFMVYEELAKQHLAKEMVTEAAGAYKAFVKRHPYHPRSPFFQLNAMNALLSKKFVHLALEEKKTFGDMFSLDKNYWQKQPAKLREQLKPQIKLHLSELAQHYHGQSQQTKKDDDYEQAIHWYQKYLGSFPKEKNAAEMNFLLAEILYEHRQFEKAALEYETTAYEYNAHPKTKEAGYAALLAYEKHKATLIGNSKNEWERKAISAAHKFAKNYPGDSRIPTILTKAAQELFKLGEAESAIRTAQKVVNYRPRPSTALRRTAWQIIAHTLFDLGQYNRSEIAYTSVLTVIDKSDPERNKMEERLAASIYKQGEQMREENNIKAAIKHFRRVAETVPNSSIRDTADYDASAGLISLKRWPEAISILEHFRHTKMGMGLGHEVSQKLAVAYQENGNLSKAAGELEKLAKYGGDYDVQRDAVYRAAELYELANDITGAINAYTKYVDTYGKPLEANVEAQYKLATINENIGQPIPRKKWLNKIIVTDKNAGDQGTDRIHYLAAKSSLELAEPIYEQYSAVKLRAPFKKYLKQKKDYMQQTIKAYNIASDYGIASITTVSTYQIAEIYGDFATALLTSERPRKLSSDELEMYDIMLEEQAYPFEEKAIEIHEKNANRVTQNIYDESVKMSFAALSKLLPGRYDKNELTEPLVDVLN